MLEHDAYILLNLISGIGPSRTASLIQKCGSATAIFEERREALAGVRGISEELARKIVEAAHSSMLDEELDRIALGGVEVVTRADAAYPKQFEEMEDAPLCLYICGALPETIGTQSIAIVG